MNSIEVELDKGERRKQFFALGISQFLFIE